MIMNFSRAFLDVFLYFYHSDDAHHIIDNQRHGLETLVNAT